MVNVVTICNLLHNMQFFIDHTLLVYSSKNLSERRRNYLTKVLAEDIPIDVRPTDINAFSGLKEHTSPKMCVWVRAKGHIGA